MWLKRGTEFNPPIFCCRGLRLGLTLCYANLTHQNFSFEIGVSDPIRSFCWVDYHDNFFSYFLLENSIFNISLFIMCRSHYGGSVPPLFHDGLLSCWPCRWLHSTYTIFSAVKISNISHTLFRFVVLTAVRVSVFGAV